MQLGNASRPLDSRGSNPSNSRPPCERENKTTSVDFVHTRTAVSAFSIYLLRDELILNCKFRLSRPNPANARPILFFDALPD